MFNFQSFINNEHVASDKIKNIFSPLDGSLLGKASYFGANLNDYADKLNNSFLLWKCKSITYRLKFFKNLKNLLRESKISQELSMLIHKEVGKPMNEAETEVAESIDLINYYEKYSESFLRPKKIEIDEYWKSKNNFLFFEPVGIIGIIKPWNYPLTNSLWSIIPAIVSGNIVLYKPSEYASLTGGYIGKLLLESNFPPGVFNLMLGDRKVGRSITECPYVTMISFTGSHETALDIQRKAAYKSIIRKYSFETSGSDYAVIDADVNLNSTINGILWGAFNNAGQVCTSIENVFIHDSIEQKFIAKLSDKANELIRGKDYGPIQNKKLAKKVSNFLDRAKKNNECEILSGGTLDNSYLPPTIVKYKHNIIINEELFCNIMRLFTYKTFDEVIKTINSSRYGLGCTIWTSKPKSEHIKKLTSDLNVGMVCVNDVNVAFPQLPWTGRKDSGIGQNLGISALSEFSCLKSVSIDNDTKNAKEWWFPYE